MASSPEPVCVYVRLVADPADAAASASPPAYLTAWADAVSFTVSSPLDLSENSPQRFFLVPAGRSSYLLQTTRKSVDGQPLYACAQPDSAAGQLVQTVEHDDSADSTERFSLVFNATRSGVQIRHTSGAAYHRFVVAAAGGVSVRTAQASPPSSFQLCSAADGVTPARLYECKTAEGCGVVFVSRAMLQAHCERLPGDHEWAKQQEILKQEEADAYRAKLQAEKAAKLQKWQKSAEALAEEQARAERRRKRTESGFC